MRNTFVRSAMMLTASVMLSFVTIAQAQSVLDTNPAHNISGVWVSKRVGPPPNPDGTPAPRAQAAQTQVGLTEKARPQMTAWAKAKFDANMPSLGPRDVGGKENDPTLHCDPDGVPKILNSPEPFEIFQVPGRILMLFEKDHQFREIWTDGRKLPENPDPTWYGTSVGHWEGDTLVVESNGFNEGTWLDYYGDPHSDQMHLTERYKRVDKNTLSIGVIVTDPKAYTAPWVGTPKLYTFEPTWEIKEWFCTQDDNEGYNQHIRIASGLSNSTPK